MRSHSWSVVVLALGLASTAQAAGSVATVRVDLNDAGEELVRKAGISKIEATDRLEGELNRLFQAQNLSGYLRSFADAQSFTTRGMGVDYASNFSTAMIGVAGNVSLNVERGYVPQNTLTAPPASGVGTSVTLIGGVNLDLIGLPLTLYGNYFQHSGSLQEFSADARNWGAHLQLKLFGPGKERARHAILRWGGFDITSGVEQARLTLTLSKPHFKRDVPVGPPSAPSAARLTFDGDGSFGLDMSTMSIPLELTTNFRIFYFLSAYGGVGFDWQVGGESTMKVGLDANHISGSVPSQNISAMEIGTAHVSVDETQTPSAGRLRFLLGVQVNLAVVKLFTQLNLIAQEPGLVSLAIGARVAF